MSRIHVLMCCHNGQAFVTEQLRSILDQQLPVHVVHVHDFASRDDTVAKVQAVASSSSIPVRLRCHAAAPGASLSFFHALQLLAVELDDHDVVLLADQDDVWLPSKTAVLMAAFNAGGGNAPVERAVFHDVSVVDEQLQVLRPSYYTGRPFSLPRDLQPDRLLLANPVIGHAMAVSTPLVRRFVRMAQPQGYMMHDWALVLFASRFGNLDYVPQSLSLYRQHSANVLGAYGRRRLRDLLGNVSRFSDTVVLQALAFTKDIAQNEEAIPHRSSDDRWLARVAKRYPTTAYAVLAVSALVRGPTAQRKGLALFIAVHGLRRIWLGCPR